MRARRLDTLAQRWARLAPHVHSKMPAGVGPFPCVLLFHGCGGRRPFLDRYMEAIARTGVASMAIDSFAARGWSRTRALATVCTGLELPGWRRAGDVLAALWGVSQRPDIDRERLALAGWSHGGWAIMDLMTMVLDKPGEAGLADADSGLLGGGRALVLAYPYCGPGALSQLRRWRHTPEVFAFVGRGDRVARPSHCLRAFRLAQAAGSVFETWIPDGATHAFDEDAGGYSPFRYDPELSTVAEFRVSRFLSSRLGAPGGVAAGQVGPEPF